VFCECHIGRAYSPVTTVYEKYAVLDVGDRRGDHTSFDMVKDSLCLAYHKHNQSFIHLSV